MKKNFFTGILTGLFSALLLVVVLSAALIFSDYDVSNSLTETTEAEKDNAKTDSAAEVSAKEDNSKADKQDEISVSSLEIENYQKIVEKLEALDNLIDLKYLEDVKDVSFDCFLQALFGQNCKTFLDIVACPNWTKLQCLGWQQTYQLRAIADII